MARVLPYAWTAIMDQPSDAPTRHGLSLRNQLFVTGMVIAVAVSAVTLLEVNRLYGQSDDGKRSAPQKLSRFVPEREQLAGLQIESVPVREFRTKIVTDGYIASNGGFTSRGASAAQIAKSGSPMPMGQSADLLQAQSDLAAAHAQYVLAEASEKRQHALYQVDGAAMKDWQQSQAELANAAVAVSTARSKLRLLGRSDRDIAAFEAASASSGSSGKAMLGGGDKSALWLIANVREADAPLIQFNDKVEVRVSALPGRVFDGSVSYMASNIDPNTHRLAVGGVISSADGLLRPNMLASVVIDGGDAKMAPAIPRNAVIFDDNASRVWLETGNGSLELRPITLGRTQDGLVEVTSGLKGGERIVTSGALFLDQARSGA